MNGRCGPGMSSLRAFGPRTISRSASERTIITTGRTICSSSSRAFVPRACSSPCQVWALFLAELVSPTGCTRNTSGPRTKRTTWWARTRKLAFTLAYMLRPPPRIFPEYMYPSHPKQGNRSFNLSALPRPFDGQVGIGIYVLFLMMSGILWRIVYGTCLGQSLTVLP